MRLGCYYLVEDNTTANERTVLLAHADRPRGLERDKMESME